MPASMLRQPIHLAPGATPIWFVPVPMPAPASSPTTVPVVCVPWPWSSQGATTLKPQELGTVVDDGVPPSALVIRAWTESCQL